MMPLIESEVVPLLTLYEANRRSKNWISHPILLGNKRRSYLVRMYFTACPNPSYPGYWIVSNRYDPRVRK